MKDYRVVALCSLMILFVATSMSIPVHAESSEGASPGVQRISGSCAEPVFPFASARYGESGSAALSVLVAPDGSAKRIELLRSSGFDTLDKVAISAMLKCRFAFLDGTAPKRDAWGTMKVTFHQPEPIDPDAHLAGIRQVLYLQELVVIMNHQCIAELPEQRRAFSTVLGHWRSRNDDVMARVNNKKAQYYEALARNAQDAEQPGAPKELERELQNGVHQAVMVGLAAFRALPAEQRQHYCERFVARLDAGQLEAATIIMMFPALESTLDPTPAQAPERATGP